MTPKPLTKERREDIQMRSDRNWHGDAETLGMPYVLAAEAYWRSAVKNSLPMHDNGMAWQCCVFCEMQNNEGVFAHAVDCPWLLAQESE